MKEQKSSAWYTRINKKKIGALLLSACMFSSFVGCSVDSIKESLNSSSNPFYQGSGETNGSLSDYETGNPVGGSSSGNVGDFETEDIINGTTSDKTTEDYETETPNTGDATISTGKIEDYIGDEDESIYLQTKLNDDPYRTQGGYSYFYHYQHGPTTMPIAAWTSPPPATKTSIGDFTTNQITLANYQTMAESGINTIYALYEKLHQKGVNQDVKNALKYADQVGMVYYVADGTVLGELGDPENDVDIEKTYGWYMNRKAYGGTLTKDEPGIGDHNKPFDSYRITQAKWRDSKYGQTKNMYVNNLPSYATDEQLYYHGTGLTIANPIPKSYTEENWGEFVKAYIQNVKPSVYSYDFYPFRGGAAAFKNYYFSLNAAREEAAKGNIPFWAFCQVGYFNVATELNYQQMAIQVSTALAYGAKGIQWFNYWHPLEFSANFTAGLVDHYGVKTKYYPIVQKINQHIAAVDDVLMQCCNQGVLQIGASYDTLYGLLKEDSYGAVTSTSGSSGSAIVGCFDYRESGKYAYYVSSNSYTEGATVNLTFDKAYNVYTIKGTEKSDVTNQSSIKINVPAGDGVLVVVG